MASDNWGPLPAWGEKEIFRFEFRSALFQQRGMPEPLAETWADRLYERDFESDDRRICMECANRLSATKCAKKHVVLDETWQRCPSFSWQKPQTKT